MVLPRTRAPQPAPQPPGASNFSRTLVRREVDGGEPRKKANHDSKYSSISDGSAL